MNSDTSAGNWLREMELEVEAEGREWRRRRLQESSRHRLRRTARFFPQNGRQAHHRKKEQMQLRTSFGTVVLKVWRGKNPADGKWGIPIRQRWGLSPHQRLSPALEDKLAYFATVAGTYESAARLAGKVGISIEDSTVRELVQRLGRRAEEQTGKRLQTMPAQTDPERAPSPLAVICDRPQSPKRRVSG